MHAGVKQTHDAVLRINSSPGQAAKLVLDAGDTIATITALTNGLDVETGGARLVTDAAPGRDTVFSLSPRDMTDGNDVKMVVWAASEQEARVMLVSGKDTFSLSHDGSSSDSKLALTKGGIKSPIMSLAAPFTSIIDHQKRQVTRQQRKWDAIFTLQADADYDASLKLSTGEASHSLVHHAHDSKLNILNGDEATPIMSLSANTHTVHSLSHSTPQQGHTIYQRLNADQTHVTTANDATLHVASSAGGPGIGGSVRLTSGQAGTQLRGDSERFEVSRQGTKHPLLLWDNAMPSSSHVNLRHHMVSKVGQEDAPGTHSASVELNAGPGRDGEFRLASGKEVFTMKHNAARGSLDITGPLRDAASLVLRTGSETEGGSTTMALSAPYGEGTNAKLVIDTGKRLDGSPPEAGLRTTQLLLSRTAGIELVEGRTSTSGVGHAIRQEAHTGTLSIIGNNPRRPGSHRSTPTVSLILGQASRNGMTIPASADRHSTVKLRSMKTASLDLRTGSTGHIMTHREGNGLEWSHSRSHGAAMSLSGNGTRSLTLNATQGQDADIRLHPAGRPGVQVRHEGLDGTNDLSLSHIDQTPFARFRAGRHAGGTGYSPSLVLAGQDKKSLVLRSGESWHSLETSDGSQLVVKDGIDTQLLLAGTRGNGTLLHVGHFTRSLGAAVGLNAAEGKASILQLRHPQSAANLTAASAGLTLSTPSDMSLTSAFGRDVVTNYSLTVGALKLTDSMLESVDPYETFVIQSQAHLTVGGRAKLTAEASYVSIEATRKLSLGGFATRLSAGANHDIKSGPSRVQGLALDGNAVSNRERRSLLVAVPGHGDLVMKTGSKRDVRILSGASFEVEAADIRIQGGAIEIAGATGVTMGASGGELASDGIRFGSAGVSSGDATKGLAMHSARSIGLEAATGYALRMDASDVSLTATTGVNIHARAAVTLKTRGTLDLDPRGGLLRLGASMAIDGPEVVLGSIHGKNGNLGINPAKGDAKYEKPTLRGTRGVRVVARDTVAARSQEMHLHATDGFKVKSDAELTFQAAWDGRIVAAERGFRHGDHGVALEASQVTQQGPLGDLSLRTERGLQLRSDARLDAEAARDLRWTARQSAVMQADAMTLRATELSQGEVRFATQGGSLESDGLSTDGSRFTGSTAGETGDIDLISESDIRIRAPSVSLSGLDVTVTARRNYHFSGGAVAMEGAYLGRIDLQSAGEDIALDDLRINANELRSDRGNLVLGGKGDVDISTKAAQWQRPSSNGDALSFAKYGIAEGDAKGVEIEGALRILANTVEAEATQSLGLRSEAGVVLQAHHTSPTKHFDDRSIRLQGSSGGTVLGATWGGDTGMQSTDRLSDLTLEAGTDITFRATRQLGLHAQTVRISGENSVSMAAPRVLFTGEKVKFALQGGLLSLPGGYGRDTEVSGVDVRLGIKGGPAAKLRSEARDIHLRTKGELSGETGSLSVAGRDVKAHGEQGITLLTGWGKGGVRVQNSGLAIASLAMGGKSIESREELNLEATRGDIVLASKEAVSFNSDLFIDGGAYGSAEIAANSISVASQNLNAALKLESQLGSTRIEDFSLKGSRLSRDQAAKPSLLRARHTDIKTPGVAAMSGESVQLDALGRLSLSSEGNVRINTLRNSLVQLVSPGSDISLSGLSIGGSRIRAEDAKGLSMRGSSLRIEAGDHPHRQDLTVAAERMVARTSGTTGIHAAHSIHLLRSGGMADSDNTAFQFDRGIQTGGLEIAAGHVLSRRDKLRIQAGQGDLVLGTTNAAVTVHGPRFRADNKITRMTSDRVRFQSTRYSSDMRLAGELSIGSGLSVTGQEINSFDTAKPFELHPPGGLTWKLKGYLAEETPCWTCKLATSK